jgi:2-polyprenyl-3-methyl-5-hydroxy-6-metoxy-1,4-benzoquinol methylase
MKQATAPDAVGFFSDNVAEFDGLYRSSPGFQERLAIWDVLLKRYVTPGGSAYDFGCGAGIFSFRMAELGSSVVGIDGAPNMVAHCEAIRRQRGLEGVRFAEGRLPHLDESALAPADLVVSSSVVEYVPELGQTLALFARLVKPGGALIISIPNVHSISRSYQRLVNRVRPRDDVYRYILHFTSPEALSRRVDPLGLTLQEFHYYTHITRLARLARDAGLPPRFTSDLFVAVFRKRALPG